MVQPAGWQSKRVARQQHETIQFRHTPPPGGEPPTAQEFYQGRRDSCEEERTVESGNRIRDALRCRRGCGQTRWRAPSRAPPASGCGETPAGQGRDSAHGRWAGCGRLVPVLQLWRALHGQARCQRPHLLTASFWLLAGTPPHEALNRNPPPAGVSPACARPGPPGSREAFSGRAS